MQNVQTTLPAHLVEKCLLTLKKQASSIPLEVSETDLVIIEQNNSIVNYTIKVSSKKIHLRLSVSVMRPHILRLERVPLKMNAEVDVRPFPLILCNTGSVVAAYQILGPDYPLSAGRSNIEYRSLCKMNEILPDVVPKPYFYDSETNIVCTEFNEGDNLRECLRKQQFDSDTAQHVARHIATIHSYTHCQKVTAEEFGNMCDLFRNDDLLSETTRLIFIRPFSTEDPTNRCSDDVKSRLAQIYEDERLLAAVDVMKKLFLEKKDCLIHGDFHTGSVFVSDKTIKFTNMTFARIGPGSFDIGTLIANYIFSYYHHMSLPATNHEQHRAFAEFIIDACRLTVRTYFDGLSGCYNNQEEYKKSFMSEVAGFAGCEIIRRIIGAVHVNDLEGIQFAEEDALGAGIRLLQGYQRIFTIDFLMVVALMLT